jgi:hypothetical protein
MFGEFAVGVAASGAGAGGRGVTATGETILSFGLIGCLTPFGSIRPSLVLCVPSFEVAGESRSSWGPDALPLFFRLKNRPEGCLLAYSCAPGIGGGTKELEGLGKGEEAAGVSIVSERGGGISVDSIPRLKETINTYKVNHLWNDDRKKLVTLTLKVTGQPQKWPYDYFSSSSNRSKTDILMRLAYERWMYESLKQRSAGGKITAGGNVSVWLPTGNCR